MKNIFLSKLIVVLNILFVFNSYLFSGEIIGTTTKRWDLVDMETNSKIARIYGKIGDGYKFLFSTNNFTQISVVSNPDILNTVNTTSKCISWIKLPSVNGWASFETNDKNEYVDLSKWENISFDLRITDADLASIQLDLYNYELLSGASIKVGSKYFDLRENEISKPKGSWYNLNFDLSKVVLSADVTKLDMIQKMTLMINPCHCSTCNTSVYIDNLRLTRSYEIPSDVNAINQSKFNIYPNPANNTLQIADVDGEVTIYNALGMAVIYINEFNSKIIDISMLNKGVYIVKTKFGSKHFLKN